MECVETFKFEKALLVADNLKCVRDEKMLFRNLSFTLKRGEIIYCLGENGSGKTSLLKILAGLLSPSAGNLLLGEVSIFQPPFNQFFYTPFIRYVGHLSGFSLELTVEKNLSFWLRMVGEEKRLEEALRYFDLLPYLKAPVYKLSAGQRQRLSLCRLYPSLKGQPTLWLLDEPSQSLDQTSLEKFEDLLKKHILAGGRAFIATHHPLLNFQSTTLNLKEYQ